MVDFNKLSEIPNIIDILTHRASSDIKSPAGQSVFDAAKTSDGVIDNFKQGKISDCWAIAPLFAIGHTKEGAKLIHESIETLPSGNFQVTFRGAPNDHFIIHKQRLSDPKLSTGDIDVRIFELALRDYFADDPKRGKLPDPIDGAEDPTIAHRLLTGKPSDYINFGTTITVNGPINKGKTPSNSTGLNNTSVNADSKVSPNSVSNSTPSTSKPQEIEFLYKAAKNPGTYAITATTRKDAVKKDGIFPNHNYIIKSIDPEKTELTIVNPYDTSKTMTISFDNFKKLFTQIEYNELQESCNLAKV